ncbi:MAG: acyl--CoA ligase [Candidatus Krumholzibacteria bacterium]|nr:acyl--CoA ligase [Candidatus Krumholzibacteria bacterium]
MFLDLRVGRLCDPLAGRVWDRETIHRELARRLELYRNQGLGPGDRVFLHYGNTLEFFVDLLAVWKLGGCAIPIDSRLTMFEVQTLAEAARPRFSLWHDAYDGAMGAALSDRGVTQIGSDELPREGDNRSCADLVHLDAPALILFTSGTTGQPKGVVHTHRSLRARWLALQQSLGIEKFRRTLCLLPTHFGHGLICNCLFPWFGGGDLYICPPFRPDLVMQLGSLLDEHEITFMSSVPSVWRLALKVSKPPTRRSLERVFCGSAPLSAFLWRQVQKWTGTPEVFNAYGITETGSWVAGTTVTDFVPADGLIGNPWGAVIRILPVSQPGAPLSTIEPCAPDEPGYVWINTPALMAGYFEREDLTREVVHEGWFMTGDIGVLNAHGHLYLRGREREEINKGGMKVYPGDVDTVIERFQKVADVCTFAVDDPLYGQDVGVAVVLQDADPTTRGALYDWATQHLAKHQTPVRWYFIDDIPRTASGKINRDNVALVCAELSAWDPQRPS